MPEDPSQHLQSQFQASVKKSKEKKKDSGSTGYTSSASAGGQESQTQAGIDYVKKELGILTTVPAPFDYMSGEKKTKAYKLKGKDKDFFGSEASQATNKYLVSIGAAKQGNPYYDDKGNITGYSYLLTSKGKKMKYGISGGAMGSGDSTGIMTSIPISQPMHKTQKFIQGIATMAMSLVMPKTGVGAFGGFALRSTAADSFQSMNQKGYNTYMKKFEQKQKGGKLSTIMTDDEI